jgi:hypothetical protein
MFIVDFSSLFQCVTVGNRGKPGISLSGMDGL